MNKKRKFILLAAATIALMGLVTISWAEDCTLTVEKYALDAQGNALTTLTLSEGQVFTVNYTVEVTYKGDDCIYDCVWVYDKFEGDENRLFPDVCRSSGGEGSFTDPRIIGPYENCGTYDVVNTARTCAGGMASWTITVNVPCDVGCTLTPGYWKTHSKYGPAPYDDTWALLNNKEDTKFFQNGLAYYDVLWTKSRGNAYYILARAYIAAELNQLNGASIPDDVLNAWNEASSLFETYTPEYVGDLKGMEPLRKQFIELATILDDYNNGVSGPGHCSE